MGRLKSTLPTRATEVKSDSRITVINKLRIFCTQDEKYKIRKQLFIAFFNICPKTSDAY